MVKKAAVQKITVKSDTSDAVNKTNKLTQKFKEMNNAAGKNVKKTVTVEGKVNLTVTESNKVTGGSKISSATPKNIKPKPPFNDTIPKVDVDIPGSEGKKQKMTFIGPSGSGSEMEDMQKQNAEEVYRRFIAIEKHKMKMIMDFYKQQKSEKKMMSVSKALDKEVEKRITEIDWYTKMANKGRKKHTPTDDSYEKIGGDAIKILKQINVLEGKDKKKDKSKDETGKEMVEEQKNTVSLLNGIFRFWLRWRPGSGFYGGMQGFDVPEKIGQIRKAYKAFTSEGGLGGYKWHKDGGKITKVMKKDSGGGQKIKDGVKQAGDIGASTAGAAPQTGAGAGVKAGAGAGASTGILAAIKAILAGISASVATIAAVAAVVVVVIVIILGILWLIFKGIQFIVRVARKSKAAEYARDFIVGGIEGAMAILFVITMELIKAFTDFIGFDPVAKIKEYIDVADDVVLSVTKGWDIVKKQWEDLKHEFAAVQESLRMLGYDIQRIFKEAIFDMFNRPTEFLGNLIFNVWRIAKGFGDVIVTLFGAVNGIVQFVSSVVMGISAAFWTFLLSTVLGFFVSIGLMTEEKRDEIIGYFTDVLAEITKFVLWFIGLPHEIRQAIWDGVKFIGDLLIDGVAQLGDHLVWVGQIFFNVIVAAASAFANTVLNAAGKIIPGIGTGRETSFKEIFDKMQEATKNERPRSRVDREDDYIDREFDKAITMGG